MVFSKLSIDSRDIPGKYPAQLIESGFDYKFSSEKTIREELAPLT
jgi:hypothetical protein